MQKKDALLGKGSEDSFDGDALPASSRTSSCATTATALEARAGEVLAGLNVPVEQVHHEPLSVLSGGFKLRVLLGQDAGRQPRRAAARRADQPPRHPLDPAGWRSSSSATRAAPIVVSHDHRFLNNGSVRHDRRRRLRAGHRLQAATTTAFLKGKKEDPRPARRPRSIEEREKEIDRPQEAGRPLQAPRPTKARQAQSRVKRIEQDRDQASCRESSRQLPDLQVLQACRPSGQAGRSRSRASPRCLRRQPRCSTTSRFTDRCVASGSRSSGPTASASRPCSRS